MFYKRIGIWLLMVCFASLLSAASCQSVSRYQSEMPKVTTSEPQPAIIAPKNSVDSLKQNQRQESNPKASGDTSKRAADSPRSESALAGYMAEGFATYYAEEFHGRKTTNGETYDMNGISAAHPNLPMGTWLRVTYLKTGKKIVVRVNDRMPPNDKGRILDLSLGAAKLLGTVADGVAKVRLEELTEEEALSEQMNTNQAP